MQAPFFTLCYTTIRPQFVVQTVEMWLSRSGARSRVNFSVTTDSNNPECIEEIAKAKAKYPEVKWTGTVSDLPGTCVKGWNLAASQAEPNIGDVLIAVADDFVPPVGWDLALDKVAELGWWLTDSVVHVADGYNPDILTLVIVTKKRYDRFGYIFYPGYQSMFCDTELGTVAGLDRAIIDATHLMFEHMHPDCGKRERDDVDLHHGSNARYSTGRMVFEYRQSMGFPVDMGPKVVKLNLSAVDFAVHIQATKDDFCLEEVCFRLFDEGVRAFFFYIPNEYWSGKPVPDTESAEVILIANKVKNLGAKVFYNKFDITRFRAPGKSRIQVETDARNEAVAWVKSIGYDHVIIADGDELWRKGLLQELVDIVNDINPQCVYTGMVPVIGLPGYPVEGALDKATIYVRADTIFSECRGTYGTKYELQGHKIFHFTSTRKTMAEIITKTRESGHYDDPTYDFEGWIKNKLPNIRTGMLNAHMYLPYNPWPRIGAWTKEDSEEIPVSLHQYLALPKA